MKNLSERLEDYKILKRAIEQGETENGYSVFYTQDFISHKYHEVDNSLVIVKSRSSKEGMPVAVLKEDEQKKAKKRCYDKTLKFLRKNTHVEFGKIYGKNWGVRKTSDEKILIFNYDLSRKLLEGAENYRASLSK